MIFPLTGNNKIRQSLENVLKEHRLPHAVLIDGEATLKRVFYGKGTMFEMQKRKIMHRRDNQEVC